MELGENGAPSHLAGVRYCRAMRRRGAVPRASVTVRHGRDGLVLVRPATAASPGAHRRSWRGPLAFSAAFAMLVLSTTLLLTGAGTRVVQAGGPCPVRSSGAAYADGRLLLVRVEPRAGSTALVHLCADRAVEPVRAWSVRLAGDGRGPGRAVAVVQVADGVALAAVPVIAGGRTGITVVITRQTGRRLTFATRVTAG
jgi:hypothetical protein